MQKYGQKQPKYPSQTRQSAAKTPKIHLPSQPKCVEAPLVRSRPVDQPAHLGSDTAVHTCHPCASIPFRGGAQGRQVWPKVAEMTLLAYI